jgi:endonuclease/exonuclease/phosphatase family metal-dependent hydrolase
LQALINEHATTAPIKIIGDLNVKLPQHLVLGPRWHKSHGFNSHSLIMYDFIFSNELIVADFKYSQSLDYTYFCDTTGVRTWIDHCLSSTQDDIVNCVILPCDENNMSDHLPIKLTLTLACKKFASSDTMRQYHPTQFKPGKWDNGT